VSSGKVPASIAQDLHEGRHRCPTPPTNSRRLRPSAARRSPMFTWTRMPPRRRSSSWRLQTTVWSILPPTG